ncbi:hypothetical protein D3C87_1958210 [compost metagenome]
MMSRTTMSGDAAESFALKSATEDASVTSKPWLRRYFERRSRISESSSTMRMWGLSLMGFRLVSKTIVSEVIKA